MSDERPNDEATRPETEAVVVDARVPGRFLLRAPETAPRGILIGFHGYGQNAGDCLADLGTVPGSDRWALVAVDALHAFYERRTERVVRSWMTRELREETIAANVAYARTILESVRGRFGWRLPVVTFGFSQGASMAWRAALLTGQEIAGAVALAGDVPPELARLPPSTPFPRRALLGRGTGDEWYDEAKLGSDLALLEGRGVDVEVARFDGGHEWSDPFRAAFGRLLASL